MISDGINLINDVFDKCSECGDLLPFDATCCGRCKDGTSSFSQKIRSGIFAVSFAATCKGGVDELSNGAVILGGINGGLDDQKNVIPIPDEVLQQHSDQLKAMTPFGPWNLQ